MERSFNITGACNPQEHYMVNLNSRLAEIKKMVDAGKYFGSLSIVGVSPSIDKKRQLW